jgi:hypothetical protein
MERDTRLLFNLPRLGSGGTPPPTRLLMPFVLSADVPRHPPLVRLPNYELSAQEPRANPLGVLSIPCISPTTQLAPPRI